MDQYHCTILMTIHNYIKIILTVTAADLAVNKLFLDKFEENYPNVKWEIVSEENAKNFKRTNH